MMRLVLTMLFCLFLSVSSFAFNIPNDCNGKLNDPTSPLQDHNGEDVSLAEYLSGYKNNAIKDAVNTNQYLVCFNPTKLLPITSQITVSLGTTSTPTETLPDTLLIYGLNLGAGRFPDGSQYSGIILSLSSGITLDTVILSNITTVIDSKTLDVNGSNVSILNSNISTRYGVAINLTGTNIIVNNTTASGIQSGTGIKLNAATTAAITNSTFTSILYGIDVAQGAAVNLSNNKFTVGNPTRAVVFQDATLDATAVEPVILKMTDCGFICSKLDEALTSKVSFSYSNEAGIAAPFAPLPIKKHLDLANC